MTLTDMLRGLVESATGLHPEFRADALALIDKLDQMNTFGSTAGRIEAKHVCVGYRFCDICRRGMHEQR